MNRPVAIVVMGPSGTGKTTTGRALASRLGWPFAEGDDFHPPANVMKMVGGIPLTDDDRWPWLALVRDWIAAQAAAGQSVVLTCSALKRSYRDVLRQAMEARVCFVMLDVSAETIAERLAVRQGHYMPPSLLASQLATFEPLEDEEDGVVIPASSSLDSVVDIVTNYLH